jgi:hypothetical protein
MHSDQPNPSIPNSALSPQLQQYPLVEAILKRRSRRFAKGLHLAEGPLAY